ncbi:MAG: XrtA/PEP-CTERM system TPR-repeat protein PrsT [Sphingomonadales bacterium]
MRQRTEATGHRWLEYFAAAWLLTAAFFSNQTTAAPETTQASSPYEDALISVRAGQYEAAAIHLKNALQQAPDNLPARILLGEALLEMGYAAAAEKELKAARRAGADEALVLTPLAKSYLLLDMNQQLLDEIIPAARGPEIETRILLLRGEAYLGLGKIDDAQRSFFDASQLKPEDPDPLVALGRIAFIRGNLHSAADFVEKALSLSRTAATAWALKGDIERYHQNADAAIGAYDAAIAADPGHVPARLGRASVLIDREMFDAAKAEIVEIREHSNDDPGASYLEALMLAAQGDDINARIKLENAEVALKQVAPVVIQSHPPIVFLHGLVSFALGNHEEAKAYLTRYTLHRPADPDGHKLLGLLELRLENPGQAIESLEAALRIRDNDVQLLSLLATAYIKHKQYDKGTSYFRRAASLDASSAEAHTNLALGHLGGGEAALAVRELTKARALDPSSLDAAIFLSLAQLRDRDYQGALETTLSLAEDHPKNAYIQNLLGIAYLGTEATKSARSHFKRALELAPAYVPAQFNLARLDLRLGNIEAAKRRYQDVLTWPEGSVEAVIELARIDKSQGQTAAAIAGMEKARASKPELREPWFHLVRFYLDDEQFEQATAIAEDYRKQAPDDTDMLELMARVQLATGLRKAAVGSYLEMVKLARNRAPALFRLGQVQEFVGDPSGARMSYERSIAWNRSFMSAWHALINLEIQSDEIDRALGLVDEMQRVTNGQSGGEAVVANVMLQSGNPDSAEKILRGALGDEQTQALITALYRVLVRQDRRDDGLRLLEDWLEQHPDDQATKVVLANGYIKGGYLAKAISLYEKLLSSAPENSVVLNNLAWLYFETGRAGAIELAGLAYKLAPESTSVLDTYGWILVRSGEPGRGLALLREAQARASRDEAIRFHVAVALNALGRREEARVELEAALRSGRHFDGLADAQALRSQLSED